MSRFWPRAEYAEDQRFGKSILTVHSLDRAMQTGSIVGMDIGIALSIYRRWQDSKTLPSQTLSSKAARPTPFTASMPLGLRNVLNSSISFARPVTNAAGLGAIGGLVLMAGVLPLYMRGKTHVEWQDRSWRLVSSASQVEVDDWSWTGAVLGASTSFVHRWNRGGFTFLNLLGRGSIGSLAGVLGYLTWRYGIMGGKREGDITKRDGAVGVPVPA